MRHWPRNHLLHYGGIYLDEAKMLYHDCGPAGETQQIAHSDQLWARRSRPGLRCSGDSCTCASDHNSSLPETAHSLLWFAAIQRIERIEGLASLAPKGRSRT